MIVRFGSRARLGGGWLHRGSGRVCRYPRADSAAISASAISASAISAPAISGLQRSFVKTEILLHLAEALHDLVPDPGYLPEPLAEVPEKPGQLLGFYDNDSDQRHDQELRQPDVEHGLPP
ncbi:MAG: hypothetical protein WCQ50_02680 [Spirochaetota bacterium]